MSVRGWLLATAVVGALGVAGTVAVVSAQEGETGEGRAGILERVAAKLGVDVDALGAAFRDARLDAVDDALAAGRINEEQAARARERIEEGRLPFGPARARVLHHARHAIVESAAAALGMTADELRAELRGGKSIADVAGERGVPVEDVKAAVLADAEATLAELVAQGRIDQARADQILARLTGRLDEIVERTRPS